MLSLAGVERPPFLHGAPFLGPEAEEPDHVYAHRDRIVTHIDRSRAGRQALHYIRNYMPDRAGFFPAYLYEQVDISYDEVLVEAACARKESSVPSRSRSLPRLGRWSSSTSRKTPTS